MLGSLVRSVAAVLLGLLAAMVFIVGVEGICAVVYPLPAGVDPSDCEALQIYLPQLPIGAFLVAVTGWTLASFVSSWLATRLGTGRHLAHGILVGMMLFVAVVANMIMLPYPLWFWVSNLILFPTSFVLGARLGRGQLPTGQMSRG